MGQAHDHPHTSSRSVGRKLQISTFATALFVIIELSAGLYSNSLALIGDSLHNFLDALALILAWLAVRLERKPPTDAKSYGYQRAGILAAFINAGTLVGFTLYILYEAYRRFLHPQPVAIAWMVATALAGLALNGFITFWLHEEGKADVNIRSAVIHMLGDAASSAGILIAAGLIRMTGSTVFDPIVSVTIALLILWSSWGILREAVNLLLEGTPRGIDPVAVTRDLAAEPGVAGVHHLHIWAIAPSRSALSCHLMVGDVSLRETGDILQRVSAMLTARYRISHTTIQFEHGGCGEDNPLCLPETPSADRAPSAPPEESLSTPGRSPRVNSGHSGS